VSDDPTSSLLRGVRTLIGLAEMGKPVSFGVLAESLGLPPSSAHRILSVLKQAGYVRQDPTTGSYSPGTSFLRAAALFSVSSTYSEAVRDTLQSLVEQSGESAFYGAYLGESERFKFLTVQYSDHAIQYVSKIDTDYSLLWGASGRAIASLLPEDTLKGIYDREKDSGEGNTPLPPWKIFKDEMRQIREAGYCATSNSRFEGAHSVAAPIVGFEDRVIGCVGISMPSIRQSSSRISTLADLVRGAASHLSLIAQIGIDGAS
jgi:DNA-binding IclR family transcriptional regulator